MQRIAARLEEWLTEHLFDPATALVPRRVHPNALSLTNHAVCWLVFAAAVMSTRLPGAHRPLALFLASAGTFGSMLLDQMDGRHARRTNQCSKLGEVIDHGLDAIHVPLITAGFTIALQMDPWAVALVHVSNAMIYNAQVALLYETGDFVEPSINASLAQLSVALDYVLLGALLYFTSLDAPWVRVAVALIALLTITLHLKLWWPYFRSLRGRLARHLEFIVPSACYTALYWLGAIDRLGYVLIVTLLSFRLTGSLVLRKVLLQRHKGADVGLLLWPMAILITHLTHHPMAALPYLACATLAGLTMLDFGRHFSRLTRPGTTA